MLQRFVLCDFATADQGGNVITHSRFDDNLPPVVGQEVVAGDVSGLRLAAVVVGIDDDGAVHLAINPNKVLSA